MSALDEVIDVYTDGGPDSDVSGAARAELALLRRCRDAVRVVTSKQRWWSVELAGDHYGCAHCTGRGVDVMKEYTHAPNCPALAIDALAKEVRGV